MDRDSRMEEEEEFPTRGKGPLTLMVRALPYVLTGAKEDEVNIQRKSGHSEIKGVLRKSLKREDEKKWEMW